MLPIEFRNSTKSHRYLCDFWSLIRYTVDRLRSRKANILASHDNGLNAGQMQVSLTNQTPFQFFDGFKEDTDGRTKSVETRPGSLLKIDTCTIDESKHKKSGSPTQLEHDIWSTYLCSKSQRVRISKLIIWDIIPAQFILFPFFVYLYLEKKKKTR